MKDLSIYIHIPFCVQKCQYCDFLSGPAGKVEQNEYMNVLLYEIEEASQRKISKESIVRTVFIGGGTPTVVSPRSMEEVLCKLKESFSVDRKAEVTIECNPGTTNREALSIYQRAGVNRLSIGLQSTQEKELKVLGRIHTYEDFMTTYQTAREVGFQNINIDLMSSIPGQTMESFRRSLEQVIALSPEHISVYSLIVEEGTPFFEMRDKLDLPDEDTELEIDKITREVLSLNNYKRYEISNYARNGKECRHNRVYWERGNYLGFGLGAASLVEDFDGYNYRYSNVRSLEEYSLRRHQQERKMTDNRFTDFVEKSTIHQLSDSERMEEFMFLGLREMSGVSSGLFLKTFGKSMQDVYGDVLCKLEKDHLILIDNKKGDMRIQLTERGVDISNIVLAQFLF